MSQQAVYTAEAAPPAGPYSQAVKVNGLIFCSGQIHADAEGNMVGETIEERTEQVLKNMSLVLKAAGSDMTKVVKVVIFLDDMGDFAKMNSVYGKWFTGEVKPARSCVAAKQLPKGATVEMECIALA
ncbi:YjgF-like protein [Ascobolus immersus RN42]|uniref:YjgF-like protein n=1 Tax=Ascobolus immersus RN42 TaxID=1160509 RepID=A0A3N4I3W2_ASCIM|nr:YjgF-like protein [Ascobolus immersus RN42]